MQRTEARVAGHPVGLNLVDLEHVLAVLHRLDDVRTILSFSVLKASHFAQRSVGSPEGDQ